MKRIQIIFLVMSFLAITAGLVSLYSDEFLIGAYSTCQDYEVSDAHVNSIAELASEAGFNALVGKTAYSPQDSGPENMFCILNSQSLDAIFEDWIFYPSSNPNLEKYGYSALSSGVNMRFEAEYASGEDVNTDDANSDRFFYMSPASERVGYHERRQDYSNHNRWTVDDGTSGYAYKDITYRWLKSGESTYRRVGREFRLLGEDFTNGVNVFDINNLHIDFVFRVDELANYSNEDTLAIFSFVKFNEETAVYDSLYFYYNDPNYTNPINKYSFTKGEYNALPPTGNAGLKSIRFTFVIGGDRVSSEYTLVGQGVAEPNSWHLQIKNLNPWMYWRGKGKLKLDYIEYKDDIYEDYTAVAAKRAKLRSFGNVANVKYYHGIDEPKAPHFEAYKKLKEHLADSLFTDRRYLITAVNLDNGDLTKSDSSKYRNPTAYMEHVEPRLMLIDVYPFADGAFHWNDPDETAFVQEKFDFVCDEYHYFRNKIDNDSSIQTKLGFIPQTFGEYKRGNNSIWIYLLPPKKTARMLQLLPLCYRPDGIVSFMLDSDSPVDSTGNRLYGLVWHTGNNSEMYPTLQYEEVQAANRKIKEYAPILQNLKWVDSETIGIDPHNVQNVPFINSLQVQHQSADTQYQGYIQTGYYRDLTRNRTLLMCVNRRTDIVNRADGLLHYVQPSAYNDSTLTTPHNPQTLKITPGGAANSVFGTHLAMYDPYDEAIYRAVSDTISVAIGPGDGKLLEMCGTLPSHVAANSTLSNKAVLEGTVNILPGVSVSTTNGAETRILSNSVINIGAGASYTLRGDVIIGDGVTINVSQNGSLNFDDADCTWGTGSYIVVNEGTLSINGGNMLKSSTATTWGGIRVSDSNSVLITDANISDAHYHSVTNSNLEISDSKISFPANSLGLLLQNNTPGYSTEISASDYNEKGIFGESNTTSRGITLGIMKNPVIIDNVTFHNLKYGIEKTVYPHASNSITWCRFVNCGTGIQLNNNGYFTSIQRCTFTNNQTGKQGIGVKLKTSLPSITGCSFDKLSRGIFTEFSLATGPTIVVKIKESEFKGCEAGIESRSSNHRLETNYFIYNEYGIVNHAGSNLNLNYTASNVLMNKNHNIVFNDTAPYQSTIQLFTGYNDFYHFTDEPTGLTATDFNFDANYYNLPMVPNFTIDASYNWFQDDQVTFDNPAHVDYVYVGTYNSAPSMPAPDQTTRGDRLYAALDHESRGSYDLAAATYQAIIDDQLVAEKPHVTSAIDGLYRCSGMTSTPLGETITYFDTKAAQHAVDSPSLSAILKDYLLKLHLVNKDFQSAVDLLQPRVSEPISEVDSLRAVLDLEIVLQLAAAEETKCPVITEYTQYQYPNFQVFEVMHSKNWEKYRQALQKNNPNMANIPAFPTISNNYPNPFNPSTTIAYSIPEDGLVKIDIYNIKGQKVKQLCNTEMRRGHHKVVWNGKDKNERSVSSGVYFVRLQANGQTSARKIMLMK